MRDLETHLVATKPRVSRRASLGQNISSARSLPAYHGSKQRRRASLSGSQNAISSFADTNHQPATPLVPKKQMRRASLGQMLGNAQRFFTKDDAATCVTTESTCHDAASVISTEEEAKVLLKEVEQTIQQHEQRKMEMEQATESNLELAKARLSSGNQLGAVLSMRRVHKNTTMLAYTAGARYQLAQIRDNLQNFTGGDVAEYSKAIRDITDNLLQADAPTPDDEFLLHQLESQMEEVCV